MNKISIIRWDSQNAEKCYSRILKGIKEGSWIELLSPSSKESNLSGIELPKGPGFLIKGGGTAGGGYKCLQPCSNLTQSAIATGSWLKEQAINPEKCTLINTLPINHVSGLMPWWRSRVWGAKYNWIPPSLLKCPDDLEKSCREYFINSDNPVLISLVPTQLQRLIYNQDGIKWLKSFKLIWIGGASLSEEIADHARKENIRLAPCYGTTETAAMVTALKPDDFLSGRNDSGNPLKDISLKVDSDNCLLIKTKRLAINKYKEGKLKKLSNRSGWWKSGDIAEIINIESSYILKIKGRIDSAINSGGETIFPETLERNLLKKIQSENIPIKNILFVPIKDIEWGARIIVIFKFNEEIVYLNKKNIIHTLKNLVKDWEPAEKPIAWYECYDLVENEIGKWDRKKWLHWTINKLKKTKINI